MRSSFARSSILVVGFACACEDNGTATSAESSHGGAAGVLGAGDSRSSGGENPSGGGGSTSGGQAGRAGGTGAAAGGGAGGTGALAGGGAGGSAAGGAGARGGAAAGGSAGFDAGVAGTGTASTCPGTEPPPSGFQTCRTQQDCANGKLCGPTVSFSGCVGCAVDCQTNADCRAGEVCSSTPCFCPANISLNALHQCIPRCTSTSCQADEVCGADGLCIPKPCSAGYTCPAAQVCKPQSAARHGCEYASCVTDGYVCPGGYRCGAGGAGDIHGCTAIPCGPGAPPCGANTECRTGTTGADARGCAARACTTDGDCDCGACVSGGCANSLYICSSPPPQ